MKEERWISWFVNAITGYGPNDLITSIQWKKLIPKDRWERDW